MVFKFLLDNFLKVMRLKNIKRSTKDWINISGGINRKVALQTNVYLYNTID